MAAAGAFGEALAGAAAELTYWHLTGGFHPGALLTLFHADGTAIAQAVAETRRALASLIDAYDEKDRRYLSQPEPRFAPRFSDYAQLARVAEWAAVGDEG
jgi:ATP-dependent helicase/nuclease subunit B